MHTHTQKHKKCMGRKKEKKEKPNQPNHEQANIQEKKQYQKQNKKKGGGGIKQTSKQAKEKEDEEAVLYTTQSKAVSGYGSYRVFLRVLLSSPSHTIWCLFLLLQFNLYDHAV